MNTPNFGLPLPKEAKLELTLYEASNDLLGNSQFTVPERPEDNIPYALCVERCHHGFQINFF